MKHFAKILTAIAVAITVSACQVTIPNIFGGPPLVLTGDLANDMPGIQAYAAALKAGVKKTQADIAANFTVLCPLISQGQMQLSDPATSIQIKRGADIVGVTASASDKMVANAMDGLNVAEKFCETGQATNLADAFLKGTDAVNTLIALIKTGST